MLTKYSFEYLTLDFIDQAGNIGRTENDLLNYLNGKIPKPEILRDLPKLRENKYIPDSDPLTLLDEGKVRLFQMKQVVEEESRIDKIEKRTLALSWATFWITVIAGIGVLIQCLLMCQQNSIIYDQELIQKQEQKATRTRDSISLSLKACDSIHVFSDTMLVRIVKGKK